MNTISIALFSRPADAEVIQKRLTDAGIKVELHECKPLHGTRLEVAADQFERAHNELVNWDKNEGGIRGAIRCPECNSMRVEYPQYSHKSFMPNLIIGFLTNIGAMNKEFYCQDCHFTWPKEGSRPSLIHPNDAPYYFVEGVPQSRQRQPVR